MFGTETVRADSLTVNGAEIYHEVRGRGPGLLFISGATGDAGHFQAAAELLADAFTVVTYDRRGNSRSLRPAGWERTTIEEQADDAAGLLRAIGLAPAAVYGTSGGAIIALSLLLRHAEVVRGAILHEPPLLPVLARPEEVREPMRQMVARAMAAGGPRRAVEAFLRFVSGDDSFEAMEPAMRERLLGNGETAFLIEGEPFDNWRPDEAALVAVSVPVRVTVGTTSPMFFRETTRWLADRLGIEPVTRPGGHSPHRDDPAAFVASVRPFVRQVSAQHDQ